MRGVDVLRAADLVEPVDQAQSAPFVCMHGHDMSLVSALFEFAHDLVTVVAVVGRSYVAAEVYDDGLVGGQFDGGVQAVTGVAVMAVVRCAVVGWCGA